jgi:hypothetical protein
MLLFYIEIKNVWVGRRVGRWWVGGGLGLFWTFYLLTYCPRDE